MFEKGTWLVLSGFGQLQNSAFRAHQKSLRFTFSTSEWSLLYSYIPKDLYLKRLQMKRSVFNLGFLLNQVPPEQSHSHGVKPCLQWTYQSNKTVSIHLSLLLLQTKNIESVSPHVKIDAFSVVWIFNFSCSIKPLRKCVVFEEVLRHLQWELGWETVV